MMATRRQFLFGGARDARVARIGPGCLERQGIVCQGCRDACGARAIAFLPLPGGVGAPLVDPARCDACGECLPACPASAIAIAAA